VQGEVNSLKSLKRRRGLHAPFKGENIRTGREQKKSPGVENIKKLNKRQKTKALEETTHLSQGEIPSGTGKHDKIAQ